MGVYKFVSDAWKRPGESLGEAYKGKLVQWRQEPTINRIDRPTRLDRARALGYKAKQGFVVIRVRVPKGRRKRPAFKAGRRPKARGRFYPLNKSKKVVAEQRATRKFPNMLVLNSYWVGEDGNHEWYECILLDRSHPAVKKDKDIGKFAGPQHRNRAMRGLTSAGKKSRGLRK
jgi:large subunit ribosomal protein L15e